MIIKQMHTKVIQTKIDLVSWIAYIVFYVDFDNYSSANKDFNAEQPKFVFQGTVV